MFKPIWFKKEILDIPALNFITGKNWKYAANGKSALYHCFQSLNITGSILVPVYICDSILVPIKKSGLTPFFYDCNITDLNPSVADIEKKIKLYKPTCVLVASMYGSPADFQRIEQLCTENNILMIDDAAQSFGSKTPNNKLVGTYGNAGFFSFSPGKPTSGHYGAFFWSQNENYTIKRTRHFLFHYLKYIDFYYNRYCIYKFGNYKIFSVLSRAVGFLNKHIDTTNDDCCRFETSILGGILDANFNQTFRELFFAKYVPFLAQTSNFKMITNGKNEDNNHKFVILFDSIEMREYYCKHLSTRGIYTGLGYQLLSEKSDTSNAKAIEGKVVEIPIEESEEKMEYLIHCLNEIIKK